MITFVAKVRGQLGCKIYLLRLILVGLLLTACNPVSTEPHKTQSVTPSISWTPMSTPSPGDKKTASPSPIPTETRTSTPEPTAPEATATLLPTPSITPVFVHRFEAHPLALDAYGAAMQMKRLARFGQGRLYDVEWSPDGKYLAVATGLGIHLYDSATYTPVRLIDTDSIATKIAFSPDGKALAVARNNLVGIWDVKTGRKLVDMQGEIQGGVWTLAFGEGGFLAAYGQISRGSGESIPQFKVWQASTGRQIWSFDLGWGWTIAVDISPDGKTIAYLGDDGLALRELRSGKTLQSIKGNFDVTFSPDGKKLFSTTWDWFDTGKVFSVSMLDLESGRTTKILDQNECQYLSRTGFSAICYGANTVIVFDPDDGSQIKALSLPNEIYDVSITPDGRYLAVAGDDQVKVINIQTEQEVIILELDPFEFFAVGLALLDGEDHYVAATGGGKGLVQIWDLASGVILRNLKASDEGVSGLAFSPDRNSLASIDTQGIIRLWDIPKGVQTNAYSFESETLDGPLVFSPDGMKLALTDIYQENTFELDLQSGELERKAGNPLWYTYAYTLPYGWYTYATNGHLMSWRQEDTSLALVDENTDEEIKLPYKSETDFLYGVETIAISPDGNYLAAGQPRAEVFIWDLQSQELLQILKGHETSGADGWEGAIRHLAFSPQDNDLLLSIGWDGTARLWNVRTGRQLKKLNSCCYVDFSPDGRLLVAAGQGVIDVWAIPPWP